jgi:hypothetical protein
MEGDPAHVLHGEDHIHDSYILVRHSSHAQGAEQLRCTASNYAISQQHRPVKCHCLLTLSCFRRKGQS